MTAYSQNCVTLVVEKLVTVADFKRQPRQKYGSTQKVFQWFSEMKGWIRKGHSNQCCSFLARGDIWLQSYQIFEWIEKIKNTVIYSALLIDKPLIKINWNMSHAFLKDAPFQGGGEWWMGFTWFAINGGWSVVANRVFTGTLENWPPIDCKWGITSIYYGGSR